MNLFDLLVLFLVIAAVLIGIGSGALPQVGGLLGAFGGAVLAIAVLPWVGEPLAEVPPDYRAIVVLGGVLLVVGLGETIGSGVGRAMARQLRGGVLGTLDRVLGGFVGAGQAILVVWLVGGLLAVGPFRTLAVQAQTSYIVRALSVVLPPPTVITSELGRLLDDTGIPDLFIGLEPLPAPDVERPTDPAARAIAAAASRSTLRISALTCQLQSSGSGFVVARGYVVTNAHVIAGATTIRVRDEAGSTLDATPVFIDPDLDIALLWVPDLEAPALRFANRDPERGAKGATLGYPRGGGLVVGAAAVAGSYTAQGRDIYGAGRISRTILELRALVDAGNSGGPFVLTNGTVGGVVFAEARTDESVGYALSPTRVATAIAPSIGRTGAVGTGACIR